MTFNPSTLLPLFLLLAACSGNSPPSAGATVSKANGSATRLTSNGDMRESVRQLTARGQENLEISDGPVAGSRLVRIKSGFSEVMLARTNPDGTVSTRCVESEEGADAFLNGAPSSAIVRAAQ